MLHTKDTTFLDGVVQIAHRLLEAEAHEPVAPYLSPEQLTEALDLTLSSEGESREAVMKHLEHIALATPRTGTLRFFNQLFSGRQSMAAAGELLASLLNTSMYTFKVAGPHALIESVLTRRMCELVGFERGEGIFCPGGSLANLAALVMARNTALSQSREHGLDTNNVAVYASEDCHYSIRKACGMIGLGRSNLRLVGVDERGRMDPSQLRRSVETDLANGITPIAVVATIGTTVRGAFDPLEEVASVTSRHNIWLHVDGAFGGSVLMSPNQASLAAGTTHADSMTWDPHKMMGVPLISSVLLCKESGVLAANFNETAGYLFQADADEYNHGTRSIQCGRRNDALKLWASWKHLGDKGMTERIDHLFALAAHLASMIEMKTGWTLSCKPESVTVCFEVDGQSSEAICEALRQQQRAMVGFADVNGRCVVRVACVNADMTTDDIDAFVEAVDEVAKSSS